jgi:hypothetical protein
MSQTAVLTTSPVSVSARAAAIFAEWNRSLTKVSSEEELDARYAYRLAKVGTDDLDELVFLIKDQDSVDLYIALRHIHPECALRIEVGEFIQMGCADIIGYMTSELHDEVINGTYTYAYRCAQTILAWDIMLSLDPSLKRSNQRDEAYPRILALFLRYLDREASGLIGPGHEEGDELGQVGVDLLFCALASSREVSPLMIRALEENQFLRSDTLLSLAAIAELGDTKSGEGVCVLGWGDGRLDWTDIFQKLVIPTHAHRLANPGWTPSIPVEVVPLSADDPDTFTIPASDILTPRPYVLTLLDHARMVSCVYD